MTCVFGAGAYSKRSARFFPSRARARCGDYGGRLGGFGAHWANGATMMSCSKSSRRRQRRTRSEAKRRAWEFVRDYLLQNRAKEVARAGIKLLRQDLEITLPWRIGC